VTRVKICGCMRVADAVAAAEAGADFIGIMFAESRRRVSLDEASQIAAAVGQPMRDIEQEAPPRQPTGSTTPGVPAWFTEGAAALDRLLARKRPLVVGVFADQPINDVNEIVDQVGLDLVQLSGNEPWSDCLLANRQVVKAVRPDAAQPGAVLPAIEPGAALALMLDASRGHGVAADRALAAKLAAQLPLWLAGGLDPQNVEQAISAVRPWCVDVSTGVETEGAKDSAKIAAFVDAVRRHG
jgi:phosphoribosylanthranilate isomerase